MKNLRLILASSALLLAFACNRNPEEQKSKVVADEEKSNSVIVDNSENNKASNTYEAVPKTSLQDGEPEIKPIVQKSKSISKQIRRSIATEPTIKVEENFTSLYDIFKAFEKPLQSFTFPSKKDTVLTGIEGTTLSISANSFLTEKDNKIIEGPIEIKLREYYSIGDMLLANLSTKSGNEMLETGGMVYLEAYSGNEKLKLKEGKEIEIGFPFQEKKEGMKTFNGEWKNDAIEWIPADTAKLTIADYVDVKPVFPGGDSLMLRYISSNIKYPSKAQKDGTQGLVVVSFIVSKEGTLSDFNVLRSVSPEIDNEALRVLKSMPNWKPGLKDEKIVSTKMNLPVRFTIDGGNDRLVGLFDDRTSTNNKKFAKAFEKISVDSIQSTEISNISKYLISTSELGWINCDRFYDSKPNINFAVSSPQSTQMDVKIVFHKIRAILPGRPDEKKYLFYNIPKNEKITIIALKKVNNKPLLAIKETITSNQIESNLAYEEVTIERLKAEMNKLNNLK